MRGRFYLEDPAPADAEVYGNLKFARFIFGDKLACKAWRGKQGKPYAFYTFKSEESREAWIKREKEGEDQTMAYRKQRDESDAKALADNLAQIQVGTLLTGSWGYDQTNAELYRVVKRKGHAVWIQACVCKSVPGSAGFMCEDIQATTGTTGEVLKRIITANGVRLHECCTLTPDVEGSRHYSSWYA